MPRLTRKIAFSALLLTLPACGARSGSGSGAPAPADATAVVAEFLAKVKANDLGAMGSIWGTERGPASLHMEQDELQKRLTVIAAYLQHDSFEFAQPGALAIAGREDRRGISVRLARSGCEAVVPFTLVPWQGQWLIENIDLAPIGNPARICPQGGQGR